MLQWLNQSLESGALGPTALIAAAVLGLLSSIACACCTLPVLGAVAGYSSTQKANGLRPTLAAALCFMLGTVIATLILGSVAGLIGRVAQSTLGQYWRLFAGFILILFGLTTLRLLPFDLPRRKLSPRKGRPAGLYAAAVFGFAVGGAIGFCSLPCNPGIFIVLSAAVLRPYTVLTVAMLVAYAVGFSLPLAAVMLGVSVGRSRVKAKAAQRIIRMAAGSLLIAAGFYLLASL